MNCRPSLRPPRAECTDESARSARAGLGGQLSAAVDLSDFGLIDVAPHPALARLNGAHQRMPALVVVPRCVLVFRRIAAAHLAALQAHAQRHPAVSHFYAVFALVPLCAGGLHMIQMRAVAGHRISPSTGTLASWMRSGRRGFTKMISEGLA